MKAVCTDDFGTVWYRTDPVGAEYCECCGAQVTPGRIYPKLFASQVHSTDGWHQSCIVETYLEWGCITEQQAKNAGFSLRW